MKPSHAMNWAKASQLISHLEFSVGSRLGLYRNMADEEYIRRQWKAFYGTDIDLENPKTLCEKLQWLKLYYRKPVFTTMADKYAVKSFVSERVGKGHVIPTLAVWNTIEEIDFSGLPEQFVLKPTHDSGGLIVCQNRSSFDEENAKSELKRSLERDYYLERREWPYKNIQRRVIAEPYIESLGNPNSIEYKITCMNGKVAFVTICTGPAHESFDVRFNDHFDRNRNKMDWYVNYRPAPVTPDIPLQWDSLIEFAEALCQESPYLRVDCYVIDGTILFGEMTFYTWAGYMHFEPSQWDRRLGDMLTLPDEKIV